MTYANPTSADLRCNVCRKLAASHARCAECDILVGPGHAVTALVDGARCFTCRRVRDRWEAAEARIREAEAGAREARHASIGAGSKYGDRSPSIPIDRQKGQMLRGEAHFPTAAEQKGQMLRGEAHVNENRPIVRDTARHSAAPRPTETETETDMAGRH